MAWIIDNSRKDSFKLDDIRNALLKKGASDKIGLVDSIIRSQNIDTESYTEKKDCSPKEILQSNILGDK